MLIETSNTFKREVAFLSAYYVPGNGFVLCIINHLFDSPWELSETGIHPGIDVGGEKQARARWVVGPVRISRARI